MLLHPYEEQVPGKTGRFDDSVEIDLPRDLFVGRLLKQEKQDGTTADEMPEPDEAERIAILEQLEGHGAPRQHLLRGDGVLALRPEVQGRPDLGGGGEAGAVASRKVEGVGIQKRSIDLKLQK